MSTIYQVKATFEMTVDPTKPATLTAAADWIGKLQKGEVVAAPEGVPFKVECGEPKIVNRKDGAGE